jgi:hypothetical protein
MTNNNVRLDASYHSIAGWLSTDLGTHPGKLANGRCYFSYAGGELVRSDFEFLNVEIPEEPHASVPPKCEAAQPACVCGGSSSCCPEGACSCRSGASSPFPANPAHRDRSRSG